MNAIAIPNEELKPKTWYYGICCVCARVLALAEDTFAGKGKDQHVSAVPMSVQCDCGARTHAQVLHKFMTPWLRPHQRWHAHRTKPDAARVSIAARRTPAAFVKTAPTGGRPA